MIEISNYFCNTLDCKHYGLRNQGNIVKAGTYKVKEVKKQMLQCNVCKERFSETKNTIFFHSHYSPDTIRKIINYISEGNGVRGTARMLELSKDGVNKIVLKAGEHCQSVLANLLNSLHLEECQLDELWTFVQKKKAFSEEDIIKEYGRTWIWTVFDVNSRLIITYLVGDRTLDDCRKLFKDLSMRISKTPLFVSDELPHYQTVIFETFNTVKDVERTGKRGRPSKPIVKIADEVDYAVVHKTRENGTIIKVETRIVFGTKERIEERLKKSVSKKINTSYIER